VVLYKQKIHTLESVKEYQIKTDGTEIECINEFKYLGSYTDTSPCMDVIIQSWSALILYKKMTLVKDKNYGQQWTTMKDHGDINESKTEYMTFHINILIL